MLAVRSGGSRDWAEITLVSVEATEAGQVAAYLTSRSPNGAGIESTGYVGGAAVSFGRARSRGFPFETLHGSKTMMIDLNPERLVMSGRFTNSELFARLLMQVGETRRIQAGESFSLYDFMAAGKRHTCVYRVISHDGPD